MKKLLFLSVIFILVFGLVGCGNDQSANQNADDGNSNSTSNTTSEGGSSPKSGGSLIVAVSGDPDVMNPLYANDRVTLTIQQSLFAPLYRMNNGQKEYVLAESFTPSEDNLTYTLKLKDNLKWHDGEKITADDVIFTMESILDEKQNSSSRSNYIFKGKPLTMKKVDELTVQFILPQVSAAFEGILLDFYPIPKHVFENETDLSQSEKNQHPIGSGPFKFKEYKPGEYVMLERFDDYFAGKPYLDSIIYRIAKDPNAANIALQNGEINMRMVDPQDYQKLNDTGKFNMVTFPEGRLFFMAFNMNTEIMSKKEVRQAIAHALNKDEMIATAYISSEFADPAASVFTPDTLYQTNDVKTYEYDQAKAKELLAAAGVTGNEKIRIAYANNNKVATSLSLYTQQKLQEIGLTVELIALDPNAYSTKIFDKNAKDFEITFGGYIMGEEPDAYKSLFQSDADYNYARYKNPQLDALWEDAAVETDPAKRADLYKQIQQTIGEDVPYLPIAYPKAVIAVDKKFGGLEEAKPIPIAMFEDLSKIYVK